MIDRRQVVVAATSLGLGGAFAAPESDWPVGEPEAQGLRADALAETLRAATDLPGFRALLVARRGVLVAERYGGGATAEGLQPINSVTKSVCGMLVGQALLEGRLRSLDDTVAQLLPEAIAELPEAPARDVTLRQILCGRSGLGFDPMQYPQLVASRPLVRHALAQPAVPVPPPGWSYNDAMVALLAPILARAQAADLATLATRQLFEPLGIARFDWRRDRDGQPLAPGGLALRPRDLLKLPVMMMDGGRWQGRQVLPAAWVADTLEAKGPATWRAGPVTDIGYGYLWFTGRLHGQRVAWAWGYGGQFALLVPDLALAVATAATSPPPAALRAQTDALMTLVGRVVLAAI